MLGIVGVLLLALVVAILIITTLDKELRTLRNAYNALLAQQVKPTAATKVGTLVTAEEITKRVPVIRGHRSWVDVKARLENPFDKEAERSARVERHLSEGA